MKSNPQRLVFIVVVAVLSVGAFATMEPRVEDIDPARAPTLGALYAAPAESIETHEIHAGETLSGVLAQARITGGELSDLMLGLREHLNPRRLRTGAEITVRRWNETDVLRAVEVRLNADTTVRLARQELGWQGNVMVTPTRSDTLTAAGEVAEGRSLYEAVLMEEGSGVPVADRIPLVIALADVFEFKLDFTREIQPGDRYRLVYERESRPDGSARGAPRILAAEITSQYRPYTAIRFTPAGGSAGFYDEKGGSLKRGFTRYPIEFARVTSRFNPNRYHPVLGINRAHLGTDIGARTGTPVRATADGTVSFAGTNGGYGRMIEVRHANGYTTRYAHLSRFAEGIRVGRRVDLKQTIAYSGATGLATAPHLHYELRKNGQAIDAQKAKLPDAPPLEAKHRGAFAAVATQHLQLLELAGKGRYALRNRPADPAAAAARDRKADGEI